MTATAPDILTRPKRKVLWLPYQTAWMHDPSRFKLWEKSRRIGADYVEAYDAVMSRLKGHRKSDYLYSSADESAAAEQSEYAAYWLHRVDAIFDRFTEQDADSEPGSDRAVNAFCIRIREANCKLVFVTSSPRRLRGKGGDITISEAAHHDSPRDLWKAAKPAATWGHSIRVMSTHNGENSLFNQMTRDARRVASGEVDPLKAGIPPWSYHRTTIIDACNAGLVDKINEATGQHQTIDEFLAEERAGCMFSEVWDEEYLCIPGSDATAWLSYETIHSCESEDCPGPDQPGVEGDERERRFMGIDVARKIDKTVCWILARVGDVLVTRKIVTLEKMTLPDQGRVIDGLLADRRINKVAVDATGLGLGLAEHLTDRHGGYRAIGVTLSNPVKHELAVRLRERMEDTKVRISSDPQVREGLHKVKRRVSASGNLIFQAERDDKGHADEFWGLALAIHAAGEESGPIEWTLCDRGVTDWSAEVGNESFARQGIW